MQVEVFSDVVCPWCYIGKRHLEAALADFPHADDVTVTFRSFQLDPTAEPDSDLSEAQHLARKYGMSEADAQAMMQRVTAAAADAGLEFNFGNVHSTNTFDAHRLLHFAAEHGKQAALKERLLAAHFTNSERVGDTETLVALASEVGLDADEARTVLEGDQYAEAVREDLALAGAFGISSVPFFVIDRKYGVAGAQPANALRQTLEQAWIESHPLTLIGAAPASGAADEPGPDGCADGVCRA